MGQTSMDGHRDYDESAHIMNSSFYSSISMNTLDHAKNFRNSLIIRDSSDQSLAASMRSGNEFEESQLDMEESSMGSVSMRTDPKGEKEKEIATIQMKNSPSLSALAGILNEKSKIAEEKARLNRVMDESILEEEEDGENLQTDTNRNSLPIDSPNLIDINDTNSVSYPSMPQANNSSLYEQPDFLSTPKMNPSMNRNTNNPFLADYQLPKQQQDPIFQVQSSIQEEPELESPRRERRSSILDMPEFESRPRSSTITELETSHMAKPPTKRGQRSPSSLGFLNQRPIQDSTPIYTRHASSTSALVQQPGESDSRRHPEARYSSTDIPNDNKARTKTRSRASSFGNMEYGIRRAHQKAHTMDNIVRQGSNGNTSRVQFETDNQEKLDVQPKRKNLRGSKTTPLPPNNSSKQQRTVSAGPVLDQSSSQQQPQSQKRRSIFSLFKKKSSKETTPKKNKQTNKRHSTFMPSSITFNSENNVPPPSTPEKLTKKSHSTNTIFSTFRKNKDKEDLALLSSSTPPKKESQLDAISKESSSFSSVKRDLHTNESDAEKSRSDPWDESQLRFDDSEPLPYSQFNVSHLSKFHLTDSNLMDHSPLQESPKAEENIGINENARNGKAPLEQVEHSEDAYINGPLVSDFPKPMLPFLARHDAGEALFPKSLDKHEVESIVSLERSRSIKSNRSHRRSLTDTLSVNAQNEGMYVTEASPALISTPDLSKSPTSSILRNGRFDSMTPSNLDDRIDNEYPENIPQLTLSPQGDTTMGTIEGKFNQLVLLDEDDDDEGDKEDTHEVNNIMAVPEETTEHNDVTYDDYDYENGKQQQPQVGEDGQEFTTEMMEFASLINFGDGFNLDVETPFNHDTNGNVYDTQSLQQASPKRITNAKPVFAPETGFEPEYNRTSNEQMTDKLNQNNTDDKNVAGTIEGQISSVPNGSVENDDMELIDDKSFHAPIKNEGDIEHHPPVQLTESSTDLPDNLLEEIRSPSPSPSLQVFEPLHDHQEVHKERHSFRDILTPPAYVSDQQPSNRPLSMSFKGLNAPSLNQSTNELPLFNPSMGPTEISTSGSPMQQDSRVNFSSKIVLYDTYNLDEYDRRPELATCNMLTPQLAQMIKTELNELKSEMDIHEASRCYTHFF